MGALLRGEAGLEPEDAPAVQTRCTASVGTSLAGGQARLDLVRCPEELAARRRGSQGPASGSDQVGGTAGEGGHFPGRRRAPGGADGIDGEYPAHARATRGMETTEVPSEMTWMLERLVGPILQTAPEGVWA